MSHYLFYYLLAGLILGCIATGIEYATGSSAKRIRTLVEIFVVSILGAIAFKQLLPISLLEAIAMATIFAVVNQLPKLYFRSDQGGEILDFISWFPPMFFMVIGIAFSAWYLAVTAAIQWLLPLAVPDAMVVPTALEGALFLLSCVYCIVTGITVIVSIVTGDLRG